MRDGDLVLSVRETAKLLGLDKDTVYEMVRQNKIPHIRAGHRILIPRAALLNWLEQAAS